MSFRVPASEGLADVVENFGKDLSTVEDEREWENLHTYCPNIGQAFLQYSAALWALQEQENADD